jgi:hypothetical protein
MADRRAISPLMKERFLLGELGIREQALVEEALDAQQRAVLQRADAELRERLFGSLPPARLAQRVTARAAAAEDRSRARPWAFAALGAAVALVGLLFLSRDTGIERDMRDLAPHSGSNIERAKGLVPSIQVYRRRGASAERIEPGVVLRKSDLVQLGYVSAGRKYGVLLSIDGAAEVTLHQPATPAMAAELAPGGGERLLASAYELDAAPRFERFFLVVSTRPLAVAAVLDAARQLARDPQRAESEPLRLPDGAEQYSVLFRKDNP